jgi:hypothetical protein
LAESEAILAISFDVPAPTDAVSPVRARMSAFSRAPSAVTDSVSSPPWRPTARSTNASSRLIGSTAGDSARSTSMTIALIRPYAANRGAT